MVRIRRPLRFLLALFVATLASVTSPATGQEGGALPSLVVSDTLYEITLRGGESYLGRIEAVSGEQVTLRSDTGVRVEFSRSQIVSIRAANGRMVGESFWRNDPNRTRLFFSPTARAIPRGTGYFGVYELFIPFVGYGLTDQISIAGGSPFYLGLTGDITPPLYLAPKVQVLNQPGLQAAVGALALVIPDDDVNEVSGILYGVATAGSLDNAVTGGLGWGYVNSDLASRPVVMLGGETRISRSLKLISENIFAPGDDGLVFSGGLRFFGERLSADAGLMGYGGTGDFVCCLPLVNFIWNFGEER